MNMIAGVIPPGGLDRVAAIQYVLKIEPAQPPNPGRPERGSRRANLTPDGREPRSYSGVQPRSCTSTGWTSPSLLCFGANCAKVTAPGNAHVACCRAGLRQRAR